MAVLDPAQDTIVIRIVYDGPAYAGKTTSVRALAKGFGVKSSTPAEIEGRTLYFDWMEYTGGMFEGRQIRCQVISVPGQTILASRRKYLLETADVVVFVGDSSAPAESTTVSYLKGLSAVLKQTEGPPIGIIFQANKRDHADAVPLPRLKQALDALQLRVAVIESVATQGVGIRESFVFAVRLALDRVRELIRTQALHATRPSINSAQDLLDELKRVEGDKLNLAVEIGLHQTRLSDLAPEAASAGSALEEAVRASNTAAIAATPDRRAAADDPPRLPTSILPSGMIWPPVDGRLILHDVVGLPCQLQCDDQGDWQGTADGTWSLHSYKNALFDSLDPGRDVLIKWARAHAECLHLISPQRCIALADDGQGRFRLWQIRRLSPSLLDELHSSAPGGPYAIAAMLISLPQKVLQASERWSSAEVCLPVKLENIGTELSAGRFVGRLPDPTLTQSVERISSETLLNRLMSEIGFLADAVRPHRGDVLKVMRAMSQKSSHLTAQDIAWAQQFLQRL